ncbi:MAG: GTP cyclohydrolase I FolE [Lachnospiraceae bacterium]|nr:GTP cyclohydrolase I FolE [Lachnospiraceae bacterium]
MDSEKIEQGVRLILEGIGEDLEREGLKGTPGRISRMYEEIFGGLDSNPKEYLSTTFSVDNDEMVIEKDITFYSMCEHHLLPFYGKASVAYIPDGKVVGLSKLARTVDLIARKPQIQEKMTAEVADALMKYLKPKGAIVIIEAEHMCMTMRGIKKPGSKTVTMAARGEFETNTELKDDFFRLMAQ